MSENLNEPQSRTEEILQNALGEEHDVTPQSRVEKLLEQVVEGGEAGSALPSPTTADNGKVLGVDGGEYKLVEQSGGGTVEDLTFFEGFYGTAKGVKNGRVVTLDVLFGKQSGSISGEEGIAKLPSGWKPLASSEKFIAYPVGGSATNPITIQIGSNSSGDFLVTTADVQTTQMSSPYVGVITYIAREE